MQAKRYARPAAFALLAAMTIYGFWQFGTNDSTAVVDYWYARLPLVPLILLLACVDVITEGVGWLWVNARLGMPGWDRRGAVAFLTGRAGAIVPAQLGRLLRPHSMSRVGKGPFQECLKAEAAAFFLDATSVLTLLASIAVARVYPLATPLAVVLVIGSAICLGSRFSKSLAGTALGIPATFWWSWQTVAIVLVEMGGWIGNGVAFFILIGDLPGDTSCSGVIFSTAASTVVGAGTGLPGGIGATDGLLGMSLTIMNVPAAHLALAVAAFRFFTFWMWIPVGWIALAVVKTYASTQDAGTQTIPDVIGQLRRAA